MGKLTEFVKRNMKIYLRDRSAVFFSLMTMIIVIGLMLLFLGDMNVEAVTKMLSALPGRDAQADEANAIPSTPPLSAGLRFQRDISAPLAFPQ